MLIFQSYLSSLKRKQKEVKKKHSKKHGNAQDESDGHDATTTEEDSDLASLAREFAREEIQDSPFLRRKDDKASDAAKAASKERKASVTTPLPEKEAPFVNSLVC